MSRTYKDSSRPRARPREVGFRCRHCGIFVGPTRYGGRHRNHCPCCLYSRHVDGPRPGDRAADCGGSMKPVGTFTRRNGELVLVHRCQTCGLERHNRIAADDDFELVLALPEVDPRRSRYDAGPRPIE